MYQALNTNKNVLTYMYISRTNYSNKDDIFRLFLFLMFYLKLICRQKKKKIYIIILVGEVNYII